MFHVWRKKRRSSSTLKRQEKEKDEKRQKEEDAERKKKEDEEKKKAMALGSGSGGYQRGGAGRKDKGNRRQTEREKKRKLLAERRKPLNIDHLNGEKLRTKIMELTDWLKTLEDERYEFELTAERHKYDIQSLRMRINQFQGKMFGASAKNAGKRQVKTLANVSARAGAFK